jgi:signal transduction histidine kinase/putative methionine-R-sulfoxide reductase with GAF domain
VAFKSERPPPPPPSSGSLSNAPRRQSGGASFVERVRELEHTLAREQKISAALREVGIALGESIDLDKLLALILQKATDLLEAERATLYLVEDETHELVARVIQGDEVRSIRLPLGEGIAGHVAQSGRAVLVRDAYKDSRFDPTWDKQSGFRTRSILAVPLKNHLGKTVGVVQVLNKRAGEFTDGDSMILTSLATQAAVSIDNVRLFSSVTQKNMQLLETKEQLEHRVRDLKLLFDLESAMGRATSLDELFVSVLAEALRVTGAKAGAFALRSGDAASQMGAPLTVHVMDSPKKPLRREVLEEPLLIVETAMEENDVALVNDDRRDAHHTQNAKSIGKALGIDCTNAIAVPLEGEEGQAMGALMLMNKKNAVGFGDEDQALLLLVAANASTSIRLQLTRESREREERLTTIGRLLSGVVHDLRTPLSVISGYVQLMQHTDDAKTREEYAELAHTQFEHIMAMQRDVMEFARGERTLLVRKVYLAKFAQEIRAELENELARRGVELVIDLKDKGTARFDEGKIRRVVHNLARNAAEAMVEGGVFTITVARDREGSIVLTFTDTGPGIPKEIRHRLFQSFVTSGKKGGTGLGLAIVRRVAEEHGGTVTVSSTQKGATFKVKLPQEDADA